MKQIDSSVKFGCIIVLLLLILLAIGLLLFFIWRAGLIPINFNPISNFSSKTFTSDESPSVGQDNLSNIQDYREYTFLPFDFKFSVPNNWNVKTTEVGGDPPSQKCLTYHISSPGEFASIEVIPMCGAHGGGHEYCPETIERIGDFSDYSIGRYPLPSENPYLPRLIYTNINREDNCCFGLVSNSTIAMKITANYKGPDSEWPRYLKELDKIVLSLVK